MLSEFDAAPDDLYDVYLLRIRIRVLAHLRVQSLSNFNRPI